MKLSITFKSIDSDQSIEKEVMLQAAKLEKLLKSHSPDLIHIHATFSRTPRTEEYSCALNLIVSSETLRSTAVAATLRTSCKTSFSEITEQVKKHQSLIRKDYVWKRKRLRDRELAAS
jgi:ribosome-associated translation inhibitor RaiA